MLVLLVPILLLLTEIALFMWIGGEIGVLWAMAIVILTALLGVATLRTHGAKTLRRLQETRSDEEAPVVVVQGLLVAAAGMLLVIPGFLTDAFGALLLIPPVRTALAKRAAARSIIIGARSASAGFGPSSRPRADNANRARPEFQEPPTAGRDAAVDRRDAEDATVIDDDPPGDLR